MKKKILIFSLAYYPKHIGGAEVAIKEITDRLDPEEYEFHLLCNRYDSTLLRKEVIGNVTVHRIGFSRPNPSPRDLRRIPLHLNKLFYQFWGYWHAVRLHKIHGFNGIWAMMAHSCGVPAALFKSRFPEVPYILTLQEGDPPEHIERKMRWFKNYFSRAFTKADRIQAISHFLARWAQTKGVENNKLVVIPNAVDTSAFAVTLSEMERKTLRESLNIVDTQKIVITTSRLVHKNAIDDVIKSLKQVSFEVVFVICGTGPLKASLMQLAANEGVSGRVRFVGHVEYAALPKLLAVSDIFIRPSRSEGMGNSFIEAMAAGVPVVATQEGGIADFLFDARRDPDRVTTGFAVDKNNPTDIARAINYILRNPREVVEIVSNAKALVRNAYDWDLVTTRMKREVFEPLFVDSVQRVPEVY